MAKNASVSDVFGESTEDAARPDMRADQRLEMRDDLRAPQGLTRRLRSTQDKYGIPEHVVGYFTSLGWELEWKRWAIQGQPEEYYETELRQNYWEPVMSEKFPGALEALIPFGQKQGPIRKSDLQLMMRPSYLCDEARQEQQRVTDSRLSAHHKMMSDTPAGNVPFKSTTGRAPIQKVEAERIR